MPFTTQTSDFWGWYLRHNSRVVWKYLQDAGIDVFASGPNNNTQSFLQLTNILPAANGGFNRRWGTTAYANNPVASAPTIVRTFFYNQPQDASDTLDTANTNLWIATDNQKFYTYTDAGVAFTGHGPSNFTTAGEVSAVPSRGWLYYGNGVDAFRKVNPSITTSNTDSTVGIAIPCNAPGSQQYSDYPCVIIPATSTSSGSTGSGSLSLVTYGGAYNAGQICPMSGGSGTGMSIKVVSTNTNVHSPIPLGAIIAYSIFTWGSGYAVADVVTATGGSPNATFRVRGIPASSGTSGTVSAGSGWGYTANSSFNVAISDTGTGTGGNLICYTDANGAVSSLNVSVPGSNYVQGFVNIPAPPAGGTQAYATIYTDPVAKTCIGADVAGPMSFIKGRQWTLALINSSTGHCSDVYTAQLPYGPISGLTAASLQVGVVSSAKQFAGFTQISFTASIPALGLDPQVDTVLLLAAPDGAGMSTLYQVAQFALSSFTLSNGFYTRIIQDNLPDSYTAEVATYNVQNTLLNQNIWGETDINGNPSGILLNTPPPVNLKFFTAHQGRIFATDGKSLFYSKSVDEVTTSTGLITSKYEEAWPGDFVLPLALGNESILGLRSDGSALHAGTEKSIFTVYGSDQTSFTVPSVSFAQTGILHNDVWSVVYAEGQPSGFVWVTPDFKVMHSDFSTYQEIGAPVYPILAKLDPTKVQRDKIGSLTYGPYNLVFFEFWQVGATAPTLLLWDSKLGKWYQWTYAVADTTNPAIPGPTFVYQFPSFTSSALPAGSKFLFYWTGDNSLNRLKANYYDPAATSDRGTPIPWTVQTSWQDLGDPTSIKVINEIELTSDDAPLQVSLYGATSQAQFDSGGVLLKQGSSVTGPIASLGTQKFFCAGSPTAAKYYSLAFTPVTPGTSPSVLSSFSVEAYPMGRI